MNKTVVYGALLVALGLAAGAAIGSRSERGRVQSPDGCLGESACTAEPRSPAREHESGRDAHTARLARRLARLASRLTRETTARHDLEKRLDLLASQLIALRSRDDARSPQAAAEPAPTRPAPVANVATGAASDEVNAPPGSTAMERALVAAGIDATTATEIKRQRDELALSEIYLRDLATREGWLNTPRYSEEMAEINRQRTSIRDEIGDDAYDRYLAALDQPNRVAVNEVLRDSPAAEAGLQAGDVVLRYGDTRIFAPNELVAATHAGTAGEPVQLEIVRGGQRLEIEVTRGPLGIRVAASKGDPANG